MSCKTESRARRARTLGFESEGSHVGWAIASCKTHPSIYPEGKLPELYRGDVTVSREMVDSDPLSPSIL
ncbi:hypothetical protein [Leptolyngbya sp. FACHB-16]|uniref:hypothetical protein n=1 Tax=unclassified Leptolyngbya TaxID=2650499 RepID=UPI0016827DDC|nr:hypothetical protein [Leptolyngbya sp. FACHB-16]MBD1913538.1 hypothetical protein [Leptolyngbya sp. FACHB-8]MBD2155891.1 hypothetical protein [Leptolyngbya sp. FACHB-16]